MEDGLDASTAQKLGQRNDVLPGSFPGRALRLRFSGAADQPRSTAYCLLMVYAGQVRVPRRPRTLSLIQGLFPTLIQGASAIRRSGFPTCRLHSCAGSQLSPLQAYCKEPKQATSFRGARDQRYGKCCLNQRSAHIAGVALQGSH